jgi:hypothetical protein
MMSYRSLGLALLFAVVSSGLVGCSPSGPTLYPVTGSVTFDGKPAEGAVVVFQPAAGGAGLNPSGTVGADGKFTLSTHPHGAGAPAGDYAVTVTWYPPDARSQDNPKNKLPARYADGSTSGLKATVKPAATELEPFVLSKK